MPDGNIHGLHFVFGSESSADFFLFMNQRRDASARFAEIFEFSDQQGFRHADGRHIRQQADMAGDAETTRVRQALPVAQD